MQRIQHISRRPVGQVTRGKTAPNRLRGTDHFLAAYDPALLRRIDGPFAQALYVDLGYGSDPTTTLESADRLRQINPNLPVLGVEIEPQRVEKARPFSDQITTFRLGGFNLPLATHADGHQETVRLVRAFNVLRQYSESEVRSAYDCILESILPGGLLMDGTSDPYGRVWTANLLRKGTTEDDVYHLEALVLGCNPRLDLDVDAFQTRLPKSLIHRMEPGQPIFKFMEDWKAAVRDTRSHAIWGPRAWFIAAGQLLSQQGYSLTNTRKWLRQGWLVWQNPNLTL